MTALFALLAAPLALVNGYLAILTAAAHRRRRRLERVPAAPGEVAVPELPGRHRIAVLIPAHDEEGIIGPTVDSVIAQQYPAELRSAHVVADNCGDDTAGVARRHAAEVHVRVAPDQPGKGPALGWLVERLLAGDDVPDAVVIIDADTIIAPGFLAEVDAALDGNGAAWQAYYSVREPELSAATALRYAALALRHYVRPLGRAELGASCGLFGNGMILRTELLRNRTFSAHLTEDVEFQLELLLDGQLVGFLPSAVVEAEMPATFAAARTQNERWELGRLQLAKRFVPELLRRSCRHGGHQRIAYADAALDQLVPPLSVLAAGTGAVVAGASIAMAARRSSGRFGFRLAWASAVALAFHVIGGLRLARAPRSVYVALLQTPRLVVWKIALWVRVLVRPGSVSWRRTERNQPPRV